MRKMKKMRAVMMIDVDVKSYKEAAKFEELISELVKMPGDEYKVKYAEYKFTDRRDNGKTPDIHNMKFRHA